MLLLVLLGVQGLTLLAVLYSSRVNTERVLRDHAREVMAHLSTTVADNSRRYLFPAERAAQLSAGLVERKVLSLEGEWELETYFLDQLRNNPELTGIYFAKADGNFLIVQRAAEGFFSKRIVLTNERKVLYRYRDGATKLLRDEAHPEDDYNPQTRPWYQQALAARSLVWTEPYLFFTSKRPGITAAKPVYHDGEGLLGIIGVDIEITGLAAFLYDVPLSDNGSAFVMRRNGDAVVFPGVENQIAEGQTALPQMRSVGGATGAFLDSFDSTTLQTLNERTFAEFVVAGQPFYGSLSPFEVGDGSWLMGIVVPSSDFTGTISAQNRRYLWQLLAISLVSCLLAVPLVFGVTRPLAALYERATRDALTQLPNRSEFLRRAEVMATQARRQGQQVALAMLDLDGFKAVNDQHGHQAGDKVLEVVAKRMEGSVRAEDLVGRYGGDEFAVLLLGVSEQEAAHLVERVRESVGHAPIRDSHQVYRVGASAGVAMSVDSETITATLARADKALLGAKASGKDRTLSLAFS
jgi:diguanylate cyclase (GGDEF)-like protein